MHLNLLLTRLGVHHGAWRLPSTDIAGSLHSSNFVRQALLAESAGFDSVLVADTPSLQDTSRRPLDSLEPTVLLAAVAAATTRIGLIATVSTTFEHPYSAARRIRSLDLLSDGRAGWNIVTSSYPGTHSNFDYRDEFDRDRRYARAEEFIALFNSLWASWGEDAIQADHSTGYYADSSRLRPAHSEGPEFFVRGVLKEPPSRQIRPLTVVAASSDRSTALAALHADVVYSSAGSIDEAREFRNRLQARIASQTPTDRIVRILPGLVPVVGDSTWDANSHLAELTNLISLDDTVTRLAGVLGVDRAKLELDEQLPFWLEHAQVNSTSIERGNAAIAIARQHSLTVRELSSRFAAGGLHFLTIGSAQSIANEMRDWFESGACDGFTIMPPTLASLDLFVQRVVPLLSDLVGPPGDLEPNDLRSRYAKH